MKIRGFFRSTREKEKTVYEESEFLRNGLDHFESSNSMNPGPLGKNPKTGSEHPDPPKPRKFPDLRDAFNKISDVMNMNYSERSQAEVEKAKEDIHTALSQIKVVAFIGGSGTGKSTRAIKIARQYEISYLIDDGLLINGGRVVAGLSAKRATSKLESVRQALFVDESRAQVMRRALAENLPDKLMILGTSDGMLEKICENLWLNSPSSVIHIEDVSTEEERRKAVYVRSTQGQHTIPVPSMEIKHEFSGYFSDPLNRLLRRSKEKNADVTSSNPDYERTVVRPTFSTLGSYSISDEALADIAGIILRKKVQGAGELLKFEAEKQSYGVVINMEISLLYGFIAQVVLKEVQDKVSKGIEDLTAMNVVRVNIKAKRLVKPDKSDLPVKPDMPVKSDKSGKSDKSDKSDNSVKPDKSDNSVKPDKSVKPGKFWKSWNT